MSLIDISSLAKILLISVAIFMIDMSVSHSHTFAQSSCPSGYVPSSSPGNLPSRNYPPSQQAVFCVGDPLLQCPQGYTLNTATKQCVDDIGPAYPCQRGFTWNQLTNVCESISSTVAQFGCSPGFTLDTSTNQCVQTTTIAAQPGCSTGTFDSASGQCVQTTTIAATPICQTGTFDSTTGKCVSTVPPTCPSGYDLTRILGTEDFSQCESVVSPCPSGLLTSVSGLGYTCTDTPISNDPITCASGFQYSQVAFLCIAPLKCPSGYTLTTNRSGVPACAEFAAVICPQGSTYDVTTRTCQPPTTTSVAPTYVCDTGTLDSSSHQCVSTTTVGAATYTCPSGGTLDSSTNQCVSTDTVAETYTCPSGGTLDSGHRCRITTTLQYTCQFGTLDPSTNHCIKIISPAMYCPYPPAHFANPSDGKCYVAVIV
jgi:hypothetical protein